MSVPTWAKGTLLLALVLIAGIGIGAAYERRRADSHEASAMHHMTHRLADELALDSAQQAAVTAIFARRQRSIDSTWRALQPHVHAAMDTTLREIAAVLRPDQAAKFRSMVERMHPGALP
jgi:hypothetical protein